MDTPWYETVSLPALLRHARRPYGAAMRRALEAAGYDDIPKNGLYVLGALAIESGHYPLSRIIADLDLSKQAGGHLVDLLVMRGYLERQTDPQDRRQLIVTLTERGRDAARVQTEARQAIDAALLQRTSLAGMSALRKMLAALIGIGRDERPAQPDHHQPSGDKAVDTRNTFEDRNMDEARFDNCSMKQARFNNINLAASQFSDINMAGGRFSDVNLSGVAIDDANIDGLTIFGHDIKALINAAQGQKASS